ncbi:MAG: hypothetical protein ACD_46C00113G0004 [uncultured bacterium]|nr:MAG: hypothetical protein ACD_46C00113G0004 [uncultured bacterium]
MSPEHEHHHTEHQKPPEERSFWFTLPGIIAIFIIIMIGYYLITEHRAHLSDFLGWLPFLLIFLLCPLMHMMHGEHGGHGGHKHKKSDGKRDNEISSERKD